MKDIPSQYIERLDQNLYTKYLNKQEQLKQLKLELENLYQYLAELNYETKNNDSQYHQLQKQLELIVLNPQDYTEAELDLELSVIAKEQQIIRQKNDEILKNHQAKLQVIKLKEIALENTQEEIKNLMVDLKKSIVKSKK